MTQHRVQVKSDRTDVEMKAFELNPRINARDHVQEIRFWFSPEDVVVLAS